ARPSLPCSPARAVSIRAARRTPKRRSAVSVFFAVSASPSFACSTATRDTRVVTIPSQSNLHGKTRAYSGRPVAADSHRLSAPCFAFLSRSAAADRREAAGKAAGDAAAGSARASARTAGAGEASASEAAGSRQGRGAARDQDRDRRLHRGLYDTRCALEKLPAQALPRHHRQRQSAAGYDRSGPGSAVPPRRRSPVARWRRGAQRRKREVLGFRRRPASLRRGAGPAVVSGPDSRRTGGNERI